MLPGLLPLASSTIEPTQAEVAVRQERAGPEVLGAAQRLAIGTLCDVQVRGRDDITQEAEGLALAWPSPGSVGQGDGFARVLRGLVDPPGHQVGRCGAE